MSDELFFSLRHCLHHLYGVARTLSWLYFLPLALLALAIFPLTGCGDKHENKPDPVRAVRYVVVGAAQTLPALERTGEIHAHDETTLSFRTGGRILTRSVDIGDRVTAGQVLATLDNTTGQNQLDSARADWLVASARLKSSEAAWRNARESLGWTRLIAPQAGVITAVNASAGQVVSDGQSVLTLATGKDRDVVFDIATPDAIPLLDKVVLQVSLLSAPSVQASAVLRDITPQADPQTRTWRVRATLHNPPAAMALGASVTVTLPSSAPHGYTLPASALSRAGDKPAVFVITPQSRAQLRAVVPASYTATSVMIASGLESGDRVITAGVSTLRSGEPVMTGEVQP